MKLNNDFGMKAAKLVKLVAVNAANSTSICGFHQPKEPIVLKVQKNK